MSKKKNLPVKIEKENSLVKSPLLSKSLTEDQVVKSENSNQISFKGVSVPSSFAPFLQKEEMRQKKVDETVNLGKEGLANLKKEAKSREEKHKAFWAEKEEEQSKIKEFLQNFEEMEKSFEDLPEHSILDAPFFLPAIDHTPSNEEMLAIQKAQFLKSEYDAGRATFEVTSKAFGEATKLILAGNKTAS